jgi:hypothetical protein
MERIFCGTIGGYFWFNNTMFGSYSHGMGIVCRIEKQRCGLRVRQRHLMGCVRDMLACDVGAYGRGSGWLFCSCGRD